MSNVINILALVLLGIYSVESAKILGIFPFAGQSQYISAELYVKTLAARGHEVTIISQYPQKQKLENFRDITIKSEGYEELILKSIYGDLSEAMADFEQYAVNTTLLILENPEVRDLLHSGKYNFDLVIIETFHLDAAYAIGAHFKAHLVGFSSLGTDTTIDSLVGNTSPLSYIPLPTSSNTDRMSFRERLNNLIETAMEWYYVNFSIMKTQDKIYKTHFPHLPYRLGEIKRNFSLMILNQHFSLSFPRPYVPNMIEVGGMFINEKNSPLPKDIEDFINGAEHGVIYFAMGSNVKSKYFKKEQKEAILTVFASLKQRILWKFEDPNLPGKPDNVLISKWFPQPDILAHPNVKLFITHGGLLSTMEAVYHAKPVVGIPVFFDQFLNVRRVKQMGFGLSINYLNLNADDLKVAILDVLNNEKYLKAAQLISKHFRDQPIKPLDKAIYWTEYVLRHNGADFMRVAGQDLNFFQYHSLDTIGFILITIIVLSVIIFLIIKWTLKLACKALTSGSKRKGD